MATQIVFMREIVNESAFAEACQDGYDELKRHTGPDYDDITTFEFFITHVDGSAEWRAYGHKGLDTYLAKIIERRP